MDELKPEDFAFGDVRGDGTYLSGVVVVHGLRLYVRAVAVIRSGMADVAVHRDDDADVDAINSFDSEAIPRLRELKGYPYKYLIVMTPESEG